MSVPVLTFFNNKGGVGKTSLIYHLAWMFSELGKRVVAVDLDPQANLTSAFLSDETLEYLWDQEDERASAPTTVFRCLRPLTEAGDILDPETIEVGSGLFLVPGDLALAGYEDFLSQEWPNCFKSRPGELYRPFRVTTAFWQIAQKAAEIHSADIILVDVGPNLGAINRAVLIGTDYVVIPLAADLFSLQGLRNLGPTLSGWREEWGRRVVNYSAPAFALPEGRMHPLGYIVQQHTERLSRPVKSFERWVNRIPGTYREFILGQSGGNGTPQEDPNCLARLKNFRSLVPMALEVRKPVFKLTSADGAIGSHSAAVQDARASYRALAVAIAKRVPSLDFGIIG